MAEAGAPRTVQTHASFGFCCWPCHVGLSAHITTDIYLPALPQLTHALHGVTAEGARRPWRPISSAWVWAS